MAVQKHIIGKVVVDLILDREDGHYLLQERWAAILKKKVVPKLSDMFDKIVPADEVWKVDKLEIDLGEVQKKMSDEEVAGIVAQQVVQSFKNYKISANGHFKKRPIAMAEMETLVFFLVSGYLPKNIINLNISGVFKKSISEDIETLLIEVKRQLNGSGVLLERLAKRMVWQFHENELLVFFEKLISQKKYNQLKTLFAFLKKINSVKILNSKLLREFFWIVFLKKIFNKKIIIENIEKLFFDGYLIKLNEMGIDKKSAKKILEYVPITIVDDFEIVSLKKDKVVFRKRGGVVRGESNLETEKEKTIENPESIFCKNAGVILLHPFLTGFFKNISLLSENGKSFLSKEKQLKAIYWLHYFATGKEKAEEQDLVFAKFLCGMKIAEPIKQNTLFKIAEKEEAEKMLEAVIGHWTALKGTSTDGLREGFLQRQGRLAQKTNGHLLELENKTIDILLSKLPWGMSIVHFPWMEKPLWVQWQ